MTLQPIPADWRKAVCAILKTENPRLIKYDNTGLLRFNADFPSCFAYQIQDSFRKYLESDSAQGNQVAMYPPAPAGTTWEFFCSFQRETIYGKILLKSDSSLIIIFSAHRPLKPIRP
jgi:hypothetical protein